MASARSDVLAVDSVALRMPNEVESFLVNLGIGRRAASGFAIALAADGFETPASLDTLSLTELRDEFGFLRGHCRMVEQRRQGGGVPVVVAAPAPEPAGAQPAVLAPTDNIRALGSLQLMHEAAMAAELQRRETLQTELLAVMAAKVSATEALAAATGRMKALEQDHCNAMVTWEQTLATKDATLAAVRQELRQEKQQRQACNARVRELEVEIEALRSSGEALVFPSVTEDVTTGMKFNSRPEPIGLHPTERFVAKRCTGSSWNDSYGSRTYSTCWEFLTNYGRIASVHGYEANHPNSGRDPESFNFQSQQLSNELQPLSEEYLELAALLNAPGIHGQRTGRDGSLYEGKRPWMGHSVPSESLVGGLMRVYKKYHPSAAAQFEKQGKPY